MGAVSDRRQPTVIGRHARLELTFGVRGGRTVVTHAYAEPPLRIGRSFEIAGGAAYVILVCSAPGVFAGDYLHQRVVVGRGARVLLASQSALQVHPAAAESPARVHYDIHVEDDGELHGHWDPVIPFAAARLEQRVSLRVGAESRVYWSDALMAGRAHRGESWRFRSIDHELRFEVAGALKYLERYAVTPDGRRPKARWRWGDARYGGTSILYHADATVAVAEECHHAVAGIDGVSAGVDLVEPRLMIGRFLAREGPRFTRARSAFRDRVLDAVFGAPALVARK